jgi:predicted N-acyltransferase|tara:strand:+ start:379 stop:570 length:192 start_codon:yes stop_codon:yes gene_type:complete
LFVSENTQNSLVGENTPKALRRERRKNERESLGRKAFVGEKKKKKRFALSLFVSFYDDVQQRR